MYKPWHISTTCTYYNCKYVLSMSPVQYKQVKIYNKISHNKKLNENIQQGSGMISYLR